MFKWLNSYLLYFCAVRITFTITYQAWAMMTKWTGTKWRKYNIWNFSFLSAENDLVVKTCSKGYGSLCNDMQIQAVNITKHMSVLKVIFKLVAFINCFRHTAQLRPWMFASTRYFNFIWPRFFRGVTLYFVYCKSKLYISA